MKKLFFTLSVTLMLIAGCAGFGLPFTDYRAMNWQVEINRREVNSTCTDLETLKTVVVELEARHLAYLRSQDDTDALTSDFFLAALGDKCSTRFSKLSVPQIKTELCGDIQTIAEADKLRELGGLAFDFGDVRTRGGIELTLHIRKATKGPDHRMVAIYRLADGKVIHFNYSGTDNVDRKSRAWPLDQFFDAAFSAASKIVAP